jgi:hypothetical protein
LLSISLGKWLRGIATQLSADNGAVTLQPGLITAHARGGAVATSNIGVALNIPSLWNGEEGVVRPTTVRTTVHLGAPALMGDEVGGQLL